MFDVAPLSPFVQPIVLAAAEIYYRHTRPWFIGLLIHGSAYKGGFIPGCSDIDLRLYLEDEAFDHYGELPIELAAAIHHDLASIDPTPFQYIQTYAFSRHASGAKPVHWISTIPGTYHLLRGTLPQADAKEAQVIARCHHTLQSIPTWIAGASKQLLDHGSDKLMRHARFRCTEVWPTLYSVLTLRNNEPFAIWKLPKEEAIALLPEDDPMGKAIRTFYQAVYSYFGETRSLEDALQVMICGVRFLQMAERWYKENGVKNLPQVP